MFADDLKASGWVEGGRGDYSKGSWSILYDTSSWLVVATGDNPRTFDVHVPGEYESRWTVNLIEHLCRMEDERMRLRKALAEIRDMPGTGDPVRAAAARALERCYHAWLLNYDVPVGKRGRVYCPICGQTAAESSPEPDPAG
jgi:hypothetical protein